jgi:uncharacterized protein
MQVTELFIYPIKSLGGIALQKAKVGERGLQFDRRYMLIDENGVFITQRTFPQLTLFVITLLPDGFKITFGNETIIIPFIITGNAVKATIWDDIVDVLVAEDAINNWFSALLKQTVRLVYLPDNSQRLVNPKYASNQEQVSLSDGYPILIVSEASLRLLNTKLLKPVGMERFRPNIVINGCKAHEEGVLNIISIGTSSLKRVKPCARCTVITIDVKTGKFGKEPLKTLATYRTVDHKVLFGENMLCLNNGEISIGDALILSEN